VFRPSLQRLRRYLWVAAVLSVVLGAIAALRLGGAGRATASVRHGPAAIHRPGEHWVADWGASPQAPIASNLSDRGFTNETVREIVNASAGGVMVRVRLSNSFGANPMRIAAASIAVQRRGAELAPSTLRALTFAGRSSVAIPAGGGVASDPVVLRVHPGTHLAVSLYLRAPSGPVTQHTQARQSNWVAAGGRTLDVSDLAFVIPTQSWYLLSGVDVLAPRRDRGAVVALGDSITDGVGSPLNANGRYPNDLARRLAARAGTTLSVVDEGVGGNRVINATACCGVGAVARFRRDVLGQPGVRDVILLEGINDIGNNAGPNGTALTAQDLTNGYLTLIAQAHAAGVRIVGATMLPDFGNGYYSSAADAIRQAVNTWIRTSGAFDGVIDFDKVMQDPANPIALNPSYDSGDHLHPNAAGMQAMANSIDLSQLR
jgi:lysophospholipase L1-like esterase